MHTYVQIHFEEVDMTHYREILRLTALGCSQREICASASVSQKTVVKVQKRASELGMNWPLDDSVTDGILEQRLFPKEQVVSAKRIPDYEYIRKELLRNGVNKKLLWTGSSTTHTRPTSKRWMKTMTGQCVSSMD
jgi:hypothetical protein